MTDEGGEPGRVVAVAVSGVEGYARAHRAMRQPVEQHAICQRSAAVVVAQEEAAIPQGFDGCERRLGVTYRCLTI